MKRNIISILLTILLIAPVFAEEAIDSQVTPNINKVLSKDIPYKQPVSKRAIAKKFLFAMGGVAASSIILFLSLTAYNKLRNNIIKTSSSDYSNTLNTPTNLKDAVNIYLEKTRN